MVAKTHRMPVIVLGMHRSGTSLVSRILADMGVFFGRDLDSNHESLTFQRINNMLLRQSGASWDYPQGIDAVLRHPGARAYALSLLESMVGGPTMTSYLGFWRSFRYGTPVRLKAPWAWKDPRNTFTLPLWEDVFPSCRIIHVRRHGVDVAASLVARQEAMLRFQREVLAKTKRLSPVDRLYVRLVPRDLVRLQAHDLESAFDMWIVHTARAVEHTRRLGPRALDIRYEELLDDPHGQVVRLLDFLATDPIRIDLAKFSRGIRRERGFAFMGQRELEVFAGRRESDLARFGYSSHR